MECTSNLVVMVGLTPWNKIIWGKHGVTINVTEGRQTIPWIGNSCGGNLSWILSENVFIFKKRKGKTLKQNKPFTCSNSLILPDNGQSWWKILKAKNCMWKDFILCQSTMNTMARNKIRFFFCKWYSQLEILLSCLPSSTHNFISSRKITSAPLKTQILQRLRKPATTKENLKFVLRIPFTSLPSEFDAK